MRYSISNTAEYGDLTRGPRVITDQTKVEMRKIKGELTGRLEELKEGSIVGIEKPGGHMTYSGETRAAFIAGGTGISPMVSILRDIAHKQLKGEFVLFYSARKKEFVLYKEELEELQKRNPDIKVYITLTREEGEWNGLRGRLCHKVIEKYVVNPNEFKWWLCGPSPMLKGMRECLKSLGIDPKNIRIEGWG